MIVVNGPSGQHHAVRNVADVVKGYDDDSAHPIIATMRISVLAIIMSAHLEQISSLIMANFISFGR